MLTKDPYWRCGRVASVVAWTAEALVAGQVSASTSVSLRVILIDIISVLSYRSFLALDRPSSCIPQLCSSSLHRRNNVLCRRSHRVAHRRPRCDQYQRSLRAATGRRPALRRPDLRRQRKCTYVCVCVAKGCFNLLHKANSHACYLFSFALGLVILFDWDC